MSVTLLSSLPLQKPSSSTPHPCADGRRNRQPASEGKHKHIFGMFSISVDGKREAMTPTGPRSGKQKGGGSEECGEKPKEKKKAHGIVKRRGGGEADTEPAPKQPRNALIWLAAKFPALLENLHIWRRALYGSLLELLSPPSATAGASDAVRQKGEKQLGLIYGHLDDGGAAPDRLHSHGPR